MRISVAVALLLVAVLVTVDANDAISESAEKGQSFREIFDERKDKSAAKSGKRNAKLEKPAAKKLARRESTNDIALRAKREFETIKNVPFRRFGGKRELELVEEEAPFRVFGGKREFESATDDVPFRGKRKVESAEEEAPFRVFGGKRERMIHRRSDMERPFHGKDTQMGIRPSGDEFAESVHQNDRSRFAGKRSDRPVRWWWGKRSMGERVVRGKKEATEEIDSPMSGKKETAEEIDRPIRRKKEGDIPARFWHGKRSTEDRVRPARFRWGKRTTEENERPARFRG